MLKRALKNLLPGCPNYISIELGPKFSIDNLARPSKILFKGNFRRPWLNFAHEPGRPCVGYPGQYEQSPNTRVKFFTSSVFIQWRPWDYLSEKDYFRRYGTYENLEPTKWDLQKAREKLERLAHGNKT